MSKKSSIHKALGERLRNAREAKGWSQLKLAHILGYQGPNAGAFISKVEAGHQEPRLKTLRAIGERLGVSLEALLAK
jgi:transcriptional regulator with XRE-family HTH domain